MPRPDHAADRTPGPPGGAADDCLPLTILPQPDDSTCGPTCLHAVYRYWGAAVELEDVIAAVGGLDISGGGTLAVMLGIDALERGYRARLVTFNLHVFDPTWFRPDGRALPGLDEKLRLQAAAKSVADPRFRVSSDAYLRFLELGGVIASPVLTGRFIASHIRRGVPILTGLSATYLYGCAREFGPQDDYDDVRGMPTGHFVVLHGYDGRRRRVAVADPLADNPAFESQRYSVSVARLVPAIMLGILSYDANLLMIEPASGPGART